ncbi:MAG: L-arabinose ABC transporter ATP-binding protein AraG [Candidatus Sumerlaeota bacterium]|nr:L-arabinose ABC transporter ATP-binding protein AraG [Candidatus Sumerlaeota bacterium]
MSQDSYYLEFDHISKTFPGVKALDDVSFGVAEGSCHALIGENGAGKSTLLKILSGAYTPTKGLLRLGGQSHVFHSTAEALAARVAVIYQELHLVPEMTVAENLFLGHIPARHGIINRAELRAGARRQLETLGENISPDMKLGRLPIAQRQMVEIAKALTRGAKVIAFDEPTSSLSDREIQKLFAIIRELKNKGHVILYVSHRLQEIFEICDSVTVFRDGRRVETFGDMSAVTHDILVNRMVGRDIHNIYGYEPRSHGETALEADAIMGPGLKEPASFSVARGEILGFFGLVGAGRSELMNLIYGAVPKTGGLLKIEGKPERIACPRDAIRAGIMLCPEDRKKDGIIPIRSVLENLNISSRRNHAYGGFWINEPWERRNAKEKIAQLAIRTPSFNQLIMNLSGGNQQKVILARWLSESIGTILLDEPTRGIDVGAKSEIYAIMYELARQGIAVIMVSSDLPEVLGVSDRIAVMRGGRISAILSREETTQEQVLKLALPAATEMIADAANEIAA